MMEKFDTALLSLHTYWIRANLMRTRFYQQLNRAQVTGGNNNCKFIGDFDARTYMDYWYSGVYVVIEGYRKLNFDDATINKLLASPNVDKLRLYRHGTYHYHENYFELALRVFIGIKGVVEWINALHQSLGKLLLNMMTERHEKTSI